MQDKENRKKLIVILLLFALIAVVTFSVSYAWFQYTKTSEEEEIETGTFTITFSNNDRIKMLSAKPISDETAYSLNGKDEVSSYVLTNSGDVALQYRILLRPLNEFELKQALKLDYMPSLLPTQFLKYSIVDKGQTPTSGAKYLTAAEKIYDGNKFIGYKLDSGVLDPDSKTIKTAKDVRLWIEENASPAEVNGKSYGFKIRVQALQYGHGIKWTDYVGE